MLNVFISGLERQSGKTVVTAGLAATMQSLSYSTCVYKPIQTNSSELNGVKFSPDLELVKRVDSNITTGSTYLLSGTESPFVSAYNDGVKVDINTIFAEYQGLSSMTDCNIVEGCNSISVPVAQYLTEIDIVKSLRLPLVLVVNSAKAPVDSVLSALSYVQANKVNPLGIIINRYDENSTNLEQKYFPQILQEYSNVNILGTLPDYGDISLLPPEVLIADVLNNINIEAIFGLEIAKLRN